MKTLTLIFALASFARGQDAISLKEAVRQSIARNKVIEASGASIDAASARVTEAKSGLLPKVNYAESWARSDNPVFVFSSLLTQRQFSESNFDVGSLNRPDFLNNFQSLVTGDQPLYDAGKTKRAVRTAKLGEDLSREDRHRSQLEVIAQVVRFYWDAQLQLLEKQDPSEQDFAAKKDQIRDSLLQNKQGELFNLFVANLRDQMQKAGKIKINQEEMKGLTRGQGGEEGE